MIGAAAKAKFVVFAVFLIGAVTGAVVEKVYETRNLDTETTPERTAERRTQEVQDYLDLTPEQRQQWNAIFQEQRPEMRRLLDENWKLTASNRLKMEELQDQTRNKIRGILTDEQKKKYEEHNERIRKQRQARSRQSQNQNPKPK